MADVAIRKRSGWPGTRSTASWDRHAECRDTDPALFFPVGTSGHAAAEQIQQAKQVCATCPVQGPCLEYALATNQDHGVWGGRDEKERRMLRRQRRRLAGKPARGRPRQTGQARDAADA